MNQGFDSYVDVIWIWQGERCRNSNPLFPPHSKRNSFQRDFLNIRRNGRKKKKERIIYKRRLTRLSGHPWESRYSNPKVLFRK